MKLVGLMPVRNEEWVLGLSLRAALLFVDEMVVLDHASSDGTPELLTRIAAEHPGRVHCLTETDAVWHEASIRQRLLRAGRAAGATHLCMLDADEVLTGNLLPSIRAMFAALAPGEELWLRWLATWRNLDTCRDGGPLWDAWDFMILGFRDAPHLHYRSWERDYDIHARRPCRTTGRRVAEQSAGGVFHLAFANWRRLRVKTAWYKMTEAVRFPWRTAAELNAFYSYYLDESRLATRTVDPAWWAPYAPWRGEVELDGSSWFERECQRLWGEHGAAAFAGLELWGVPQGACTAPRAAAGGAPG